MYKQALSQLPAAAGSDTVQKLALHGKMKEALTRISILCGVPKVIETLLALGEAAEESGLLDKTSSLRPQLETGHARTKAGNEGLSTIYQQDLAPIFDKMDELGLGDVSKSLQPAVQVEPDSLSAGRRLFS